VHVKPADAFGERDPKAVLEVLRDEFPEDVAEGDVFDAEEDEGGPVGSPVVLRVLEVTPDTVILDRNHPLAGQKVRFDVEALEVRPAEDSEILAAETALLDQEEPKEALIPVASLLRGGTRR
jgi:FKBP-type peptidyl-prolyl cis-trans isomerase SlyD